MIVLPAMTERLGHISRASDQSLAEAAAWLDRAEADVLALAHRWWFGSDPAPELLDRLMAAYMLTGQVPPWARQFARLLLAEDGLDPASARRLGMDRVPPPPRHGKLIVAATCLAAVLLLFLAVELRHIPLGGPAGRMSCSGGGPGLVVLEEIAYGLAGRRPLDC